MTQLEILQYSFMDLLLKYDEANCTIREIKSIKEYQKVKYKNKYTNVISNIENRPNYII